MTSGGLGPSRLHVSQGNQWCIAVHAGSSKDYLKWLMVWSFHVVQWLGRIEAEWCMYMCQVNYVNIGSDNGCQTKRRQAII